MNDTLLDYYEHELTYIRQMGVEFAEKYPKIAGRLMLESEKSSDPHTERLIEAFAFLSGRIHKKINDDFPDMTESLLSIIYPHYNNPIPSMTIAQFKPLMQSVPETGYTIERGVKLYTKAVNDTPCQFTTSQPVEIWPIEVTKAQLKDPEIRVKNAQHLLQIQLKTINEIPFNTIEFKKLRFFLHGQHQHIFHLHELLFNNVCHIECVTKDKQNKSQTVVLTPAVEPVGFKEEEALLPLTKRAFPGYRLLMEYFSFPEKFLFFDLTGFDKLKNIDTDDKLDIRIYFNRTANRNLVVNKETFRLNASPVVNLFSKTAEPIRVEQRKTQYQVTPDTRRQDAMEVFSIDRISAISEEHGDQIEYRPFYSIRHHLEETKKDNRNVFWHVQREVSGKNRDKGTEVFLSFSDLNLKPDSPGVDVLTVHTTCTNRDLPSRLPVGDMAGDFRIESAAPVEKITAILKPTPARRPFLGGSLQWRLISHLSLNYTSLVEGGEEALREILMLYDFDNSPSTRQQINGIISVKTEHVTKRIQHSFCRGVKVIITLDEDKFVGVGLYLFAMILERFLAQYVSVNSFSQLVVKTLQRKEILNTWSPRSGNQILL